MKGKSQLEEIEIKADFDIRTEQIHFFLESLGFKNNNSDDRFLRYAKNIMGIAMKKLNLFYHY